MSMKKKFRRVLEPVTHRFVNPEYVVKIESIEMENIERIEFSPPRLGDSHFGKFKLTYKVPHLCEVSR